jgi:hypothetical protein
MRCDLVQFSVLLNQLNPVTAIVMRTNQISHVTATGPAAYFMLTINEKE